MSLERLGLLLSVCLLLFVAFLNLNLDYFQISDQTGAVITASSGLTGKITVVHTDDFVDHTKSKNEYYLLAENTKIMLDFSKTGDPHLVQGATVEVVGKRLVGTIESVEVESYKLTSASGGTASVSNTASTGNIRLLVIPIDYLDSGPRPWTREQIHNFIFNDQLQAFYNEQSYGQAAFTGDVIDWYRLPRNSNGGFTWNQGEIGTIINTRGVSLSQFDVILVVQYGARGGMAGNLTIWQNNINYSRPLSYVQGSSLEFLQSVTSHELGHNIGLPHANGLDCGNRSVAGECVNVEYGNPFDTMGWHEFYHFNAFYKYFLGWFSDTQRLIIDSPGQYTIHPLESTTAPMAAFIRRPDSSNFLYSLEYRRPIGFDNLHEVVGGLSPAGLMINAVQSYGFLTAPSKLIDLSPSVSANENDTWYNRAVQPNLATGQEFVDENYGVKIKTVEVTNESVTFDVAFLSSPCNEGSSPQITNFPQFIAAGREFTIHGRNFDTCALSLNCNKLKTTVTGLSVSPTETYSGLNADQCAHITTSIPWNAFGKGAVFNARIFNSNQEPSNQVSYRLLPASDQVTLLNESAAWHIGSDYDVTWESALSTNRTVQVIMRKVTSGSFTSDSAPPITVATSTTNDMFERIRVPSLPNGQYYLYIKVSDANQYDFPYSSYANGVIDVRDPLPPEPELEVLEPVGGETWRRYEEYAVEWSDNVATKHQVSILEVGRPESYAKIISSVIAGDSNTYTWTVGRASDGAVLPDGDYTIAICRFVSGPPICATSRQFKLATPTPSSTGNVDDENIKTPLPQEVTPDLREMTE